MATRPKEDNDEDNGKVVGSKQTTSDRSLRPPSRQPAVPQQQQQQQQQQQHQRLLDPPSSLSPMLSSPLMAAHLRIPHEEPSMLSWRSTTTMLVNTADVDNQFASMPLESWLNEPEQQQQHVLVATSTTQLAHESSSSGILNPQYYPPPPPPPPPYDDDDYSDDDVSEKRNMEKELLVQHVQEWHDHHEKVTTTEMKRIKGALGPSSDINDGLYLQSSGDNEDGNNGNDDVMVHDLQRYRSIQSHPRSCEDEDGEALQVLKPPTRQRLLSLDPPSSSHSAMSGHDKAGDIRVEVSQEEEMEQPPSPCSDTQETKQEETVLTVTPSNGIHSSRQTENRQRQGHHYNNEIEQSRTVYRQVKNKEPYMDDDLEQLQRQPRRRLSVDPPSLASSEDDVSFGEIEDHKSRSIEVHYQHEEAMPRGKDDNTKAHDVPMRQHPEPNVLSLSHHMVNVNISSDVRHIATYANSRREERANEDECAVNVRQQWSRRPIDPPSFHDVSGVKKLKSASVPSGSNTLQQQPTESDLWMEIEAETTRLSRDNSPQRSPQSPNVVSLPMLRNRDTHRNDRDKRSVPTRPDPKPREVTRKRNGLKQSSRSTRSMDPPSSPPSPQLPSDPPCSIRRYEEDEESSLGGSDRYEQSHADLELKTSLVSPLTEMADMHPSLQKDTSNQVHGQHLGVETLENDVGEEEQHGHRGVLAIAVGDFSKRFTTSNDEALKVLNRQSQPLRAIDPPCSLELLEGAENMFLGETGWKEPSLGDVQVKAEAETRTNRQTMAHSLWKMDDSQQASRRPPEDDVGVQSQKADSQGIHGGVRPTSGREVDDAAPIPPDHDRCNTERPPSSPREYHLEMVEEVPALDNNYNVLSFADVKGQQNHISVITEETKMATKGIPVTSPFHESMHAKSVFQTYPTSREGNKYNITAVCTADGEVADRISNGHDHDHDEDDNKEKRLNPIRPDEVAKQLGKNRVRRKSLYIYVGNHHKGKDVSSLSGDDASFGILKDQEQETSQPIGHFLSQPEALGQQAEALLQAQYDWTQNSSEAPSSREDIVLSRREDDKDSFGGTEQEQDEPVVPESRIEVNATPRPEVEIQPLHSLPSSETAMEPEYDWGQHASQEQLSHVELDSLESRKGNYSLDYMDKQQGQEAATAPRPRDEDQHFETQPQGVALEPEYDWSQCTSEDHSSRKEVSSHDTENRHDLFEGVEKEEDKQLLHSTILAETMQLDDKAHVRNLPPEAAVEPEYEWSQNTSDDCSSQVEVGTYETADGQISFGGPDQEYPEIVTNGLLQGDNGRQVDPQSSQVNDILEVEQAPSESCTTHGEVMFGVQQDNRTSQERDIHKKSALDAVEPKQQPSPPETNVETNLTLTPLHFDTLQHDKNPAAHSSVLFPHNDSRDFKERTGVTPIGSEIEPSVPTSGVESIDRKQNDRPLSNPPNHVEEEHVSRIESPVKQPMPKAENNSYSPLDRKQNDRPLPNTPNHVEEEEPESRIESPVKQPRSKAEKNGYSPLTPQAEGQLSMLSLSPSPTPVLKPLPVPREPENSQMHQLLNAQDWTGLLQFMAQLRKESPNNITYELTKTDPAHRATILHRMVERAPMTLTKLLVSMIPFGSRHEILLLPDVRGNTALHLACANLYIDTKSKTIDDAVIKAIGIGAPVAHEMKNHDGQIPIALLLTSKALKSTADPDMVAVESAAEALLQQILVGQPDLVSLRNKQDQTLLHIGLANGVHEKVLLHLFEQAEFTAAISDAHGKLPLHYIASGFSSPSPSIDFAEQLLLAAPEALTTPCSSGDTPLHLFVINMSTIISEERDNVSIGAERLAELLLGNFPVESMCPLLVQNKLGMTPLHCCARFAAPAAVVHILMRSLFAKRAVNMVDTHKNTPLHIVCDSPAIGSLVEHIRIMGTDDSSVRMDAKGRTPLHVAAENPLCTTEAIEAVIAVNPKQAKMENLSGRLPLHLALRKNCNEDILRKLILANPKAVKSVFHGDNGICHELCEFKAPSNIVEFLLQVYPEGARRANKLLNLPLHVAVIYMCDLATVKALVKAFPEACTTYNKRKDIPLHYASKYKTTKNIMAFLIRAAPSSASMPDANGVTPMDNCTENGTLDIAREALGLSTAKSQKSKNHKYRDSSPSRSSRQMVEAKVDAGGKDAPQISRSGEAGEKDRRSPSRSGHGDKISNSHEKDQINRRGRSDIGSPSQDELDKLTNILNRSLESASVPGDFDSDTSPSLVLVQKPESAKVFSTTGTDVKRRRSRSVEASEKRERSISVSRSGHTKQSKGKGAERSGKKSRSKADDKRRRSRSLDAPKQREKSVSVSRSGHTKISKSKGAEKKYRYPSKGRSKSSDTAKIASALEMKKMLKGLHRSLVEISSDHDSSRETAGSSNVSKKRRKSRSMKNLSSSSRSLEDLRRVSGSDHRSSRKSKKMERRRSKSMSPVRHKSATGSEHRRRKSNSRPQKHSSEHHKSLERDSNHTSSKRTSASKSSKHSSDRRSSKRSIKVESPKRDKSSSKVHSKSRAHSVPASPRGWSSPLHSSPSSGRPPMSPVSSRSVSKSSSSRIQKDKEKALLAGLGQSLRGSSHKAKEERVRTKRSKSPPHRRHNHLRYNGSIEEEEGLDHNEATASDSRKKIDKKMKKEKKKKSTKEKWAENLSILRRQSMEQMHPGGEDRSTSRRARGSQPLLDPQFQQMVDPRLDTGLTPGGDGDARGLVALPFLLPSAPSIEVKKYESSRKEGSLTQSKHSRSRSRR